MEAGTIILSLLLTYQVALGKPSKTFEVQRPEGGEIKVLLSDQNTNETINWLKRQKADFSQRHIFLFDTPDLSLHQAGVILRIRRKQDDSYDVTTKIRDREIVEFPDISKKSKKHLKCEWDIIQESFMSCALVKKQKKILGSIDMRNPQSYFDSDQKKLINSRTDISWKNVRSFDRINAAKWKLDSDNMPTVSFELWSLPNGKRFIEVSKEFDGDDFKKEKEELLEFLRKNDLVVAKDQISKTQLALESLK